MHDFFDLSDFSPLAETVVHQLYWDFATIISALLLRAIYSRAYQKHPFLIDIPPTISSYLNLVTRIRLKRPGDFRVHALNPLLDLDIHQSRCDLMLEIQTPIPSWGYQASITAHGRLHNSLSLDTWRSKYNWRWVRIIAERGKRVNCPEYPEIPGYQKRNELFLKKIIVFAFPGSMYTSYSQSAKRTKWTSWDRQHIDTTVLRTWIRTSKPTGCSCSSAPLRGHHVSFFFDIFLGFPVNVFNLYSFFFKELRN